MHDTYKADVARSKEIGDYYRDLSVNYTLYEEWNKTPVDTRDWDNPMPWPVNPHPEAMGYLEHYLLDPTQTGRSRG
jgi:hypothetical protein